MPYYKLKNDDLDENLEYDLQWNNLVEEESDDDEDEVV